MKPKKTHAEMKLETQQKVQAAIDQIQAEGRRVTRKELVRISGLSSGTFSQPHVKSILKSNRVCQFAPEKIAKRNDNDDYVKDKLTDVEFENFMLKAQIESLKRQYDALNAKYENVLSIIREAIQSDNSKPKTAITPPSSSSSSSHLSMGM